MVIPHSKKPCRWLITTIMLSCLSGCGSGTIDIMGEDTSTFVGSVSIEKKLSDRSTIDLGYLATAGSNSQFLGSGESDTGIQFDGMRVTEGTLDNEFTFQTVTAHYEYTYLLTDRFRLTAAPALQLSFADIEGRIDGFNPTLNEFLPAFGLKLGSSLHFTDRTSAVAEAAVYNQTDSHLYFATGIWVSHLLRNNIALKFGYSTHYISDDTTLADRCDGPISVETCSDSGLSIEASGLHVGLSFKR